MRDCGAQAGAGSVAAMTLVLMGQLPSGKGQIRKVFRGERLIHYPQARFSKWRADASKQLLGQFQETIGWRCSMEAHYTPGDLKTRDVSGLLDALFHLFGYAGVIKDDGLIRDIVWREHPLDRKSPMVRVELRKL